MTQFKTAFILLLSPLLFLLAKPADTADVKRKECIALSRGKELKEYLQKSNVLLVLGNDHEDKTYKEICTHLESTPMGRVEDFEIAFVEDTNMKRNVMKIAKPPSSGVVEQIQKRMTELMSGGGGSDEDSSEISYPEYVLYKKNTDSGIRLMKGDIVVPADEDGEEGKGTMTEAVLDFISEQLESRKIGSFVYALGAFDIVASQIMKYDDGSWQQKLWAEGATRLIQSSLFTRHQLAKFFAAPVSPVMEFEIGLTEYYTKVGKKVLEKGKDYTKDEVKRLEDMLENDKNSISEMKKESMFQRVYILKRFTEPLTFEDKDVMMLLFKIGTSGMMILLLLGIIPVLLLPSPEEEEENEDIAGEEMEDPDKDDSGSESETSILTKQEKRALAIQRAKESMKQDKGTSILTKQEKRALAIQRAKESMKQDKENVQTTLRRRKG